MSSCREPHSVHGIGIFFEKNGERALFYNFSFKNLSTEERLNVLHFRWIRNG